MNGRRHPARVRPVVAALAGACAIVLVTAQPAQARAQLFTGTLAQGQSFAAGFTATAAGTTAVSLEWDNPASNLNLFLLRRSSDGVYRQIAAARGTDEPEVLVVATTPGLYRMRVTAIAGAAAFKLRTHFPVTAPAHPKPGFATIMFGRSMRGAVDGSCTLLPGAVSLQTMVQLLATRGIAATGNATVSLVGTCKGGTGYASWNELTALHAADGLTVTSRGKTDTDISTLTPDQQLDQTCGSLPVFASHGFDRAWGLFSYPGGIPVESVQEGPVVQCFAYGRDYEYASNPYPLPYPYLVLALDTLGGRCRNQALACYGMTIKNNHSYIPPALLLSIMNEAGDGTGRWSMLQAYRIVTGNRGTTTSTGPAWDCRSANPRDHWTTQTELYCQADLLWVVDHIDPSVTFTDPATLGAAQGRDKTPPALTAEVRQALG